MSATIQRRSAFIAEMGLGPVWTLRDATPEKNPLPDMSNGQSAFLHAEAELAPSLLTAVPVAPSTVNPTIRIAEMNWSALAATVAECTQCGLCRNRTHTVLGAGDQNAKWLFVGEGPGRNEDLQGEPFVGVAGKLLDNLLVSMGLRRGENAYIANIVKCRPTDANGDDRPPTAEEAAACLPYLERQIALIQPAVIVALGKTAAVSLLGLSANIAVAALRGTVHRYREMPVIVTYHPAYLLRQPAEKGKVWSDLCLAMTTYSERAF